MGGLIQLKVLSTHSDWPVRAQVLSNPMLGVAVHVPEFKQMAARWSLELLPKLTLFNEIREKDLTSDPKVINAFAKDSLRHNRISAGVYLGSLEATEWVMRAASNINVQTLLQISSHDPIVSSEANRQYFSALSCAKKVYEYEGFKHELYNELDRQRPLEDLTDFLQTLHTV